ncbi:MAG: uracil-DNA glycosylase family protein [Alphaproteobacteria bacterium]|nr:uracil-DNA glycosylase family protein [Alphaproteobacteria bacterium]
MEYWLFIFQLQLYGLTMDPLLEKIKGCTLCAPYLPDGVRPVLQAHASARILIAGQAPGRKVHESGIPFDDASGDRLRNWMGIDRGVFYDASKIAILPMGFCFPGAGKSGDLPPRPECAPKWRQEMLDALPDIQLTLVIGRYAMDWHLGNMGRKTLTEVVSSWRTFPPNILPLPHPSPRNNIWLRKNLWFDADVLPALKERVEAAMTG